MISFSIQSFGCRVNQAEAFLWADEFQKHGLRHEEDFCRGDLVLVNTCTLTSRADSDVRGFLRRVARENPKARMVVTGCFVERVSEELRNIPQVWRVFSNREKENLASRILSLLGPQEESAIRPYRSRALIKIQDGCNLKCTFCIIPSVRGKNISVEREKIFSQVEEFTRQGFREVVLTGIHLCLYGLDMRPQSSLLALLQELENIKDLGRIRLSSLDPRFLGNSLLKKITSDRKICPHFHLSLQHGSDDILLRMGRKVKTSDYKKILAYLHQSLPHASLGADIIVGFPGEADDDFERTFRFLDQSPLTYFHVFSYSPRPGTMASTWPQVKDNVKTERSARLRRLSKEKNKKYRSLFIGEENSAVVIKKEKGATQVLTSNYINVFVPSCPAGEKEEVRVKIMEVNDKETIGKIV